MSEAVSALAGSSAHGFVDVTEAGLVGMVTIRGDYGNAEFRDKVATLLGLNVPDQRQMTTGGTDKLLWMSPDELLLVCPHGEADARVGALSAGLSGVHHLAVNVSDARAAFCVKGTASGVREALAKLSPADLRASVLPVGEVRRTRLAQVPAAIWLESEDRAMVVCFRSVAGYVFDLLTQASKPGSEPRYF
jgi:sarcosine oxidase subunit gamma